MTSATFIDANVPIYAAGASHSLKTPCVQILLLAARHPGEFVTDAEVLQEMLHRYVALKRWPQGREVLARFSELMLGYVEPVIGADVEQAAEMVDMERDLSARDLLHAAIMRRLGITTIISSDAGFDDLQYVERLDPARLDRWRSRWDRPTGMADDESEPSGA